MLEGCIELWLSESWDLCPVGARNPRIIGDSYTVSHHKKNEFTFEITLIILTATRF